MANKGTTPMTCSVVSVPVRTSDGEEESYLDFEIDRLPSEEDALTILQSEDAHVELWHHVALLYYRSGNQTVFSNIADIGYRHAVSAINRGLGKRNEMMSASVSLLLSIAAYNAQMGFSMTSDAARSDAFIKKAMETYNVISSFLAAGTCNYEAEYYVGRGFLHIFQSEFSHANSCFSLVLNKLNPNYIPAIIGIAMLEYNAQNYTSSLNYFRKVLVLNPNGCPANIRVGIGHCLWKLDKKQKAKLAFERAVELFPNDPNGLCGLAICRLSEMSYESNVIGMKLLSRAVSVSKCHPMSLTLLADHFYFKREYDKAVELAHKAFIASTRVPDIMKRSALVIGRCHEEKSNNNLAIHYYYEALREPDDAAFILPRISLARCYIRCNDIRHATSTVTAIRKADPKCEFASRMLGCLFCNSEDLNDRLYARAYLQPILEQNPEDCVARIAFATAHESCDDLKAASNYSRALEDYEKQGRIVLPEIYNNYGSTLFRLKRYKDAVRNFELALEMGKDIHEVVGCDANIKPINVTILFNLARAKEALFEFGAAELIYKSISREHPTYYACLIRLGIIAREKGNLHEADSTFKQALDVSNLHPDVWTLMANLHVSKGELEPAWKKYTRIKDLNENMRDDSYNLIALGNVELIRLQMYIFGHNTLPCKSTIGEKQIRRKAMGYYHKVLMKEPTNIWAANGIGCILACRGQFTEARDAFFQALEATNEFPDVRMNIAHTYFEEERYHNAIQFYERCKECSTYTQGDLLQYIAESHIRMNSFDQARIALMKCRRILPDNLHVLFQLAKVIRKRGYQPFQVQSDNNLDASISGINQIRKAQTIFDHIERSSLSSSRLRSAAKIEFGYCEILVRHTPYKLDRLETAHQEQQELKSRQNAEVKAFQKNQLEEKRMEEEDKRKKEEAVRLKREEIRIKTEKVKLSLEMEGQRKRAKRKDSENLAMIGINVPEDKSALQDDVNLLRPKSAKKKKLKGEGKRKRKQQRETKDSNGSKNLRKKRRKRIISRSPSPSDVEGESSVSPQKGAILPLGNDRGQTNSFPENNLVSDQQLLENCQGEVKNTDKSDTDGTPTDVKWLELDSMEHLFANSSPQLNMPLPIDVFDEDEPPPVLIPADHIPYTSYDDADPCPPVLHRYFSDYED